MKIVCHKCGEKLNKKAKFCLNCGETIDDINERNSSITTEVKRKSLKNVIVFGSIGVVILIVIIMFLLIFNSSINKFERAIKAEEYTVAYAIYNKNKDNIKFNEEAKFILDKSVDVIKQDYIQKIINKDYAKFKLNDFNNFVDVKPIQNYIENLDKSRISYNDGLNSYNKKDYELTIISMKGVISEDENYNDAINKIKESKVKYKESLMSEAKSSFEKSEYEQAIDILNKYEKLTNEKDNDISNLIKECETEISIIKAEERKKLIENISSKISIVYDKVEDKYIIVPKNYSTKYVNIGYNIHFEPIINYNNKDKVFTLMYRIGFSKSDWVFFDKIIISNEKDKFEIKTDYQGKQTQVLYGGEIAEWYSIVHNPTLAGYLDYVLDFSDVINLVRDNMDLETTIRFKGEGYYDVVISKSEKQNIVNFYDLYNALKEDAKIFDELNK